MTATSRSSDPAVSGLDLPAVAGYLTELGLGEPGDLRATLITGGKSNLTYLVESGTDVWVLRRPPLGHVLTTAHDMGREYRVMAALRRTSVPVPDMIAFCDDTSVLGAPFYLMSNVDGKAYRWAEDLKPLGPRRTGFLADAMMRTLALLHTVPPESVGLNDFGRPAGYLARQVARWGKQLEASRTRELSGIDDLRAAVADRLPDERAAAIVHGDFRLDNLLVDSDDTIRAVIDWEMATLGDPLSDLALTLAYAELARRQWAAGVTIGIADASTAPGFPGDRALVDSYVRAGGHDVSGSDFGWYLGLAFFKLAVILEGIYFRHSNGQTLGEGFETAGQLVGLAVEAGLKSMEADI